MFILTFQTNSFDQSDDRHCGINDYIDYIEMGDIITFKTERKITQNANLNCTSESLIHCAICVTSKGSYIGQIGKTTRTSPSTITALANSGFKCPKYP